LKEVFAIILTLGNYMNGGNMSRGQADGFGLEILPKLKDVKSKDSKITLLHYIVKMYMKKIENPFEPNVMLPVPEPGDIKRAASVNFEDVRIDLQKLEKQLAGTTTKIVQK
jgi:formin 2